MANVTPHRISLARNEMEPGSVTVELYEQVDDWGFGVMRLSDELDAAGKVEKIKLKIHSSGGDVLEAFAIYSILVAHPAAVEVEIIGLAASSASVIAMAGDRIKIAELGYVMIHDPWTCACGSATEMRTVADMLDKVQPGIVKAYLRHSKMSSDDLSAAMSAGGGAGTWYDAEAAVAAGLAHEIMSSAPVVMNSIRRSSLAEMKAPQGAIDLFTPSKQKIPEPELYDEVLELLRSAPLRRAPKNLAGAADLQALLSTYLEASP